MFFKNFSKFTLAKSNIKNEKYYLSFAFNFMRLNL